MVKLIFHISTIALIIHLSVTYLDSVTLLEGDYGYIISFLTIVMIFSFVELFIHPLIRLVLLPIRLITFGIVSVLTSTSLVYIISLFWPLFNIDSIYITVLLGLVFGILQRITK